MKKLSILIALATATLAVLFSIPAMADVGALAWSPGGMGGMPLIALGGMIINADTLRALQQGFNAAFMQGFGSVKSTLDLIAMRVPSSTLTENYGWMKELPGMREWIGQRVINNLESAGAQLTNKHYEHTIGVDRDNISDDRLGIFTPMFSIQGETVARHPDELVWGMLPKGFTTKGFDGQYFFDTDHVGYTAEGVETSWSNTGGGAGAPWFLMDLSRSFMKPMILQDRQKAEFVSLNRPDDTNVFMDRTFLFGVDARYVAGFGFHQLAYGSKAALDAASFAAARLDLETQRRPDGTPLPVMASHLVTGPSNRAAAEAVLMKEYLAAGETNTNYKAVNLVIDPRLG
ncbi:phage head protein [Sulfurimicrobium lacus]|uniref:Phage head protein n=1 Tax=Sulfurimicrobium lacus TaxID=2715678 RepID=A0A6F8VAW3_9PROT|nr:Mu-like prophage major head subunit gpT family protein [Sulfurimicrobium lacus]BCB26470.1 phage head protein [Sulfurimicrobium lacus]